MQRSLLALFVALSIGCLVGAVKPSPVIQFKDASSSSGLSFVLENSPQSRKYLPETMAGGIAAFDYNNDGRLDLFFANGAELPGLRKSSPKFWNRLYRNDGNGHFTDVTEEVGLGGSGYATGVAAGDYDNDGYVDLFVSGVHESHLYRNVEGKRFEDVTVSSGIAAPGWAVAASWLDADQDGRLDLFVVNYVKWSAQTNPLCHDPSGRYPVYCNPNLFSPTANQLFHNLGHGRFQDISKSSGIAKSLGKGMSAVVADYDGDGYPDIFVTNDTLPNFLFHNLGHGRFEELAFDAGVALSDDGKNVSGMGADFRDYNNNGRPDIVLTDLTGQTFLLFKNLGKGQFQDVTTGSHLGRISNKFSGWGIAFADMNNDGWKDLFTANSHVTDNIDLFSGDRYREPNLIMAGNEDGIFADVSAASGPAFAVPRAHRGLVVADFDGDGKLDAVVTSLGEKPEFWRNVTPDSGHWVDFKLVGTVGNRDAIGAVLHLTTASGEQWNTVTSSVGYASSCLCPVHFGLGSQTTVKQLEITWPGGRKQLVKDVHIDRLSIITEEQTAAP
ncbi:MAG TPA: CRTAC1 family protein [Bryobacteraceae bacterium]